MRQQIRKIAAIALVLLGTGHTLLTPHFFPDFNPNAVWFGGSGLTLILLGFLNLAAASPADRLGRWLSLAGNLLGLTFAITVVAAVPVRQAFIFLALAAVLTATSVPLGKATS